ncbi:MAG: DNA replication and repair protein RecF [Candidatus Nomurabacteria bacterium]|jgi:DNA replication and repair protein RecF|nr:DNA replication and repair protein RecF [Candidatus Nomurabacteria bacterium]
MSVEAQPSQILIKSLRVQNFRRHQDFSLDLDNKNTIITGENGSGKTSLIEAIYIALAGKSWRSNFSEITRRGAKWWRADVELGHEKRVIKFQNQQKQFKIDGDESKILPKTKRRQTVLFEPNHLNLLSGSPSRRRDFFDKLIADQNYSYQKTLRQFDRVLKQRNTLLKNAAPRDQLFTWDIQFTNLAAEIVAARRQTIDKINQTISDEYQKIAFKNDKIQLAYDYYSDSFAVNRQTILDELTRNFSREVACGHTSIGPHQHDISFVFNSKPAELTVSRGENRTIILALKKIEYEMKKSTRPLILLDDILSEFDEKHQRNLMKSFFDNQVIITSVKAIKNHKFKEVKIQNV